MNHSHGSEVNLFGPLGHSGFEPESELSEDEIVKAREGWMKKMAEARAEIILRVEDSQLSHMRSWDPMEIWMALARVYIV